MKKLLLVGIAALSIAVQAATTPKNCGNLNSWVYFVGQDDYDYRIDLFRPRENDPQEPRTGWYLKTNMLKNENGIWYPKPGAQPTNKKNLIAQLKKAADQKAIVDERKKHAINACIEKRDLKQQEDARRAAMYPQTPPPTPTRKK